MYHNPPNVLESTVCYFVSKESKKLRRFKTPEKSFKNFQKLESLETFVEPSEPHRRRNKLMEESVREKLIVGI